MKPVKLSLVAALAAGAFSVANATPLEEAIRDIDVKGALRYRYQSGNIDKKKNSSGFDSRSAVTAKQAHNFLAKIGFDASIADNFKAFLELTYNAGQEPGYNAGSANTTTPFYLRQYYLTYTDSASDTSLTVGKWQLDTIWTTKFMGLVGIGAKVVNTSIDGTALAAFAVDSFDYKSSANGSIKGSGQEGDTLLSSNHLFPTPTSPGQAAANYLSFNPYDKNLYGVAAIGSYDVGFGQFNPQLWLAYLTDTAFFYALDLGFKTTFANDLVWKLNGAYLGNSAEKKFKNIINAGGSAIPNSATNGNFVALKGTIEYMGFDGSLGGYYYGDKNQLTITTLEDNGGVGHLLAGEEIFYTAGSNLSGDIGRNTFGYVTAGYTFDEVLRLGVDFVYGGTKISLDKIPDASGAGKKLEAVARVDYKYSPKLDFKAWYSYVNVDAKEKRHDGQKNTFRLQALYKF